MELEGEDDEFDIQDAVIEGARVDSNFYDAFVSDAWPPSNARLVVPSNF